MKKLAVITGIAGQDGAFLAHLLIKKGYRVIGADRRRSYAEYPHLIHLGIIDSLELVYFDLLDPSSIDNLFKRYVIDEFYNLAAQSFVQASFDMPILTAEIDGIGVLRILEAIRNFSPKTKFYQASTSEMFGKVQEIPQSERTSFYPRSPYGVSKLFAHWMVTNYRESYGIFACSGILFNHESEYRGSEFVTQKIIKKVVQLEIDPQAAPLKIGNLDARRDWGHAIDYVNGMYLMMQLDYPSDFVLATGEMRSVREFIIKAFQKFGHELEWKGEGLSEKAYFSKGNRLVVEVDPKFFRPCEVDQLLGDASLARKVLGWVPAINLDGLVDRMVEYEFNKAKNVSE
jgi:GDPmannose 4,6-dehydratase